MVNNKTIYLCYKNKNIPDYVIKNLSTLNPEYKISLYDDKDCIDFLYSSFSQKHADLFNFVPDGPIKADFWRICVLYFFGGVYCDIDIHPLVGFDCILEKNVTFLTSASKINTYFNPIILIAKQNHIILEMCIQEYIKKFNNSAIKKTYTYWDWSICPLMYKIFYQVTNLRILNMHHTVVDYKNDKYQFLSEYSLNPHHRSSMCTKYKNITVCNNHYDNYKTRAHNGIGFVR